MANYDQFAAAVKELSGGKNVVLMDDVDLPSIYVPIYKMKNSQLITGGSENVHPAFLVNGKEKERFFYSKYQNVVINGRAYSLPHRDPAVSINFDNAIKACEAKGTGFHLGTRAEWAAIALLSRKNGTMPHGNNNYGSDIDFPNEKGSESSKDNSSIKTGRCFTGSGPATWGHDHTAFGIQDMNGNVWELTGGLRTVYGEVQILVNNDAADNVNSQSVASDKWKAIDATTGDFIVPDGNGTTANSVKMDWKTNKVEYSTTITAKEATAKSCKFHEITVGSSIADPAKEILKELALLPEVNTDTYGSDKIFINNGIDERIFISGEHWKNKHSSGIFSLDGDNSRKNSFIGVGFRSSYIEL